VYPPPIGPTALPKDWFRGLSTEQQRIATISARLHDRVELVGACYLLTFFLHQFFKCEYNIVTKFVIGWINDGTDDLMISHAWLEYDGRKTDVSITCTEHPDVQKSGPMLIHDAIIVPGEVSYTYHYQRSAAGLLAVREIAKDKPDFVEFKEQEHAFMRGLTTSDSKMRDYLDNAPIDRNYRALRALVKDE
jgi:hypothetical protein